MHSKMIMKWFRNKSVQPAINPPIPSTMRMEKPNNPKSGNAALVIVWKTAILTLTKEF